MRGGESERKRERENSSFSEKSPEGAVKRLFVPFCLLPFNSLIPCEILLFGFPSSSSSSEKEEEEEKEGRRRKKRG